MTAVLQPALLLLLVSSDPDAVFLRHEASVEKHPDGTFTEVSEEWIVPLTPEGVRRYSRLSIPWQEGYDEVSVEIAELRPVRPGRPDSPAIVTDGPRGGMADASRLESSFRQIDLAFTTPEIGDTLVVRTVRTVHALPLAPCYSYSFFFQSADSIASSRFTAVWPEGETLHSTGTGSSGPVVRSEGGRVVTTWTCGPSPHIESGFSSIPLDERAARVTVSDRTMQEVSAMLWAALDPGPPGGPSTALLDSVISFAGDDPESLRRWVAEEIGYLGAELGGEPGYTPSTPEETVRRGFGACRDSAMLLLALIRRAGIQSGLCLARSDARLDSLAGSRSFDHMLVFTDGPDGRRFLDPTARVSTAPYGCALRGMNCLPLVDGGCGLDEIPAGPFADTFRIEMRGSLSPAMDTLACDLEIWLSGAPEELWRSMMSGVAESDRPEALRMLLGCLPGSRLELRGSPSDLDSPIGAAGLALYPIPVLETGGSFALLPPGLSEINQTGTRLAARLLSAGPEPGGLALETPMHEELSLEISLEGWRAEWAGCPADAEGYSIAAFAGGGMILVRESAFLGPARLDGKGAERLLETLRERSCADRRVFLVEREPAR